MNFDSYYDPPEYPDPPPQVEELWALLEGAGVDEDIIDRVCAIVTEFADIATQECSACERRANEAEALADKSGKEWRAAQDVLPQSSLCPHGSEYSECDRCLIEGDLAYDKLRERKYRWSRL